MVTCQVPNCRGTTLSKVTGDRPYAATRNAQVASVERRNDPNSTTTTTSATYVSSEATEHLAIGNVDTLEGATGTEATISCGLRWKVSGITGSAIASYLLVKAKPRS